MTNIGHFLWYASSKIQFFNNVWYPLKGGCWGQSMLLFSETGYWSSNAQTSWIHKYLQFDLKVVFSWPSRSSQYIKSGEQALYTQSPIIKTSRIRTADEFLGKFTNQAVGSSNLRTTSKNLRTATAQIFKAKNRVCIFTFFSTIYHLYVSSIFSLFLVLSWTKFRYYWCF